MEVSSFLNPQPEFRIIPFWFWNGTLEEGEIVRQIKEMAEKGLGGFCISPRPGLRIPHLSKAWFDRIKLALKTASSCGLKVWLHDEYLYPGTMAGGQVNLGHPHYRAQFLTFRETIVQGGQQVDMELPWATVLLAIAIPLKRDRCLWEKSVDISNFIGCNQRQMVYRESEIGNAYHNISYLTQDPGYRLFWKAPTGRWRVLIFQQAEFEPLHHSSTYFDPYNPKAVSRFIETAQEPYFQQFKEHFGKTFAGIMTSETIPQKEKLPWSPLLPKAFEIRNGYPLLNCLPALITEFGPNTSRIRYDYFQTLGELHRDSYQRICAGWCDQQNVNYASDLSILRNSHRNFIHIPGTQGGQEKIGASNKDKNDGYPSISRWNPKFSASLAHQTDKERIFTNCFRNTGWSLTLQDMKVMVDRLGALGSNLFAFHGFFYTVDGLRKRNTPPSQFLQNPYWKNFRILSDYVGRLSYSLSLGKHVADIALVDPVTSLWSHLRHSRLEWQYLGYDSDEATLTQHLIADWAYLMEALSRMHRDYHCIDPQMIEKARVSRNQLRLGNATYNVLILPPITNLERGAFDVIRKFLNAGGKVISLGLLPIEDIQEGPSVVEAFSRLTDMDPGRMIRDYTGHELGVHLIQRDNLSFIRTGGSVKKNQGATALRNLLDQMLPRHISVQTGKKENLEILCTQRNNKNKHLFFLTNTSSSIINAQIKLRIPSTKFGKVEKWDLESGQRTSLPMEKIRTQITLNLPFQRLESHLLVVTKDNENKTPSIIPKTPDNLSLDLNGLWKVDPEEDNALRLDQFRMQLDPKNQGIQQGWQKLNYSHNRWTKVNPKPFSEQIRKGIFPNLPLAFSSDSSISPVQTKVKFPLVCWFRSIFSADVVPGKIALVMDRSAIVGDYQIYLNGNRLPNNAFRPTFRYDNSNLTCAVGRRVLKGKNVLAVRVEINKITEGLVDAFYLFGRFRVKSWRNLYLRLIPPIERGPISDLDALGLPFYAGTIAYTKDIVFPQAPQTSNFILNLEKNMKDISDIVEILINGKSCGVRAWAPYSWIGETAWLKKGKNRITIRITNTLSRLLTAQKFQSKSHKMTLVKV